VPTKVCPRCSVLSETDADTCPNCGASYARAGRGLSRVEKGAIAVTALALAAGGAALALRGDDEAGEDPAATPTATPVQHTIRFEQAARLPAGVPYDEVIAEFGPPRPNLEGSQKRRLGANECIYYDIAGERTDAMLCFKDEKLTVVAVNYPDTPPPPKRGGRRGQGG
jgi:RNA polymerase subunit RPABC4/transcription elongation factor Spt4